MCVYNNNNSRAKKHEFERNKETMEKFEEGERKNNINIFLFLIILRKYMA